MSDKRNPPSAPTRNSLGRPADQPGALDDTLAAPSHEGVAGERPCSAMREPEHSEEEGLGSAIRHRFAPYGGVTLPEHPPVTPREPPDFAGRDYAWLETEEGHAALAERFHRLFGRKNDDA